MINTRKGEGLWIEPTVVKDENGRYKRSEEATIIHLACRAIVPKIQIDDILTVKP